MMALALQILHNGPATLSPPCPICRESGEYEPRYPVCPTCARLTRCPEIVYATARSLGLMASRNVRASAAWEREDYFAQVRNRVLAELDEGPELDPAGLPSTLTRELTVFDSFGALLDAAGGYWPKLDTGRAFEPDAGRRERAALLCDLYDRAQRRRGDPRRATRNGAGGI